MRYKEIMSGAREAAGGQDSANKSSVLEMSSAGRVSIGYRT